jgi:hypothetical protein
MTSLSRSILGILVVTAASSGCDLVPADEVAEGPASDMEVTPAALKLKPSLLLEAGATTQSALGVYAWEVSMDKEESIVLGLTRTGKRVLTARASRRDPSRDVGRVTFQGERQALKFSFDKVTRNLKVSGGPALKLIDVMNAYGRDEAAGKVLKKYDENGARSDVLICGGCALGALGCAGTVAGCVAASSATGGLAGLACAARTVATCGAAAVACYVCISSVINSSSSGSVEVQEGESSDISNICMRKDPCWCDEHPNECFSPVES